MKIIFALAPVGSILSGAFVVQKTGITLSAELAITVLINVAFVAIAFGGIQATLKHLRADLDRMERLIERRFDKQDNAQN